MRCVSNQLYHELVAASFVLVWLFYLYLSIKLSDERLLADSAYYFFRVANQSMIWIEHQRYVLCLTQLLPWLGSLVSAPLAILIHLNSLNPWLFGLLISLWLLLKSGQPLWSLIIPLMHSLGLNHGFFVPMFELYYAADLLVLYLALRLMNRGHWLLRLLIGLVVASAHPTALLLLLAAEGLLILRRGAERYQLFLITVLVIFAALKSTMASTYESDKTAYFISNLTGGFYAQDFYEKAWRFYLNNYWWHLPLLLGAMALHKIWQASLMFAVYLGLLIIIHFSFTGLSVDRYQQQVYFPATALLLLFLAFSSTQRSWGKGLALGFVLFLNIYAGWQIWQTAPIYQQRTNEIQTVVKEAQNRPDQKFIVAEANLKNPPNWSYPLESMIFSSREGLTQSIVTDLDYKEASAKFEIDQGKFIFRRWEVYPLERLNPRYWQLETGRYRPLPLP